MNAEVLGADPYLECIPQPTEEDTARILGLIDAVRFDNSTDGVANARALRAEGALAATVALRAASNLEIDKYRALDALDVCANEASVPAILEFALSRPDRCPPSDLFVTLARVADSRVIPHMQRLISGDEVADTMERSAFAFECTRMAITAAERSAEGPEKDAWEQAILVWAATPALDGDPVVDQSVVDDWRNEANPAKLAFKHAYKFMTIDRTGDPDFPAPALQRLSSFNPTQRVNDVANVHRALLEGTPALDKPLLAARLGACAQRLEATVSPFAVPLGIELEIEQESIDVRPGEAPDEIAARLYNLLLGYRRLAAAGIPPGKDELWETAHRPSQHPNTTLRELQLMYAAGLINPDITEHPVHLTIGGVTKQGDRGPHASLLARILEATGYATTGDRMLRPTVANTTSWIKLSNDGVLERSSKVIEGDTKQAVELRIFVLKGLTDATRFLYSAYSLGSAVAAYQKFDDKSALHPAQLELAGIWTDLAPTFSKLFADYGMQDPLQHRWQATTDHQNGSNTLDSSFIRLGNLLGEAEHNPQSAGGKFRQDIRELTHQGQTAAMRVLRSTRKTI